MTKQDRAGGHPSRICHGLGDVEQLALHRFVAHGVDRGEEYHYIPLKVTPQTGDASVVARGLQEILELDHERLARLDVMFLGQGRASLNRLIELLLEPQILVAHRLPCRGRLLARRLPFPFPLLPNFFLSLLISLFHFSLPLFISLFNPLLLFLHLCESLLVLPGLLCSGTFRLLSLLCQLRHEVLVL